MNDSLRDTSGMALEARRHLRVLEMLAENQHITQRTRASKLGIALGLTNLSVKQPARAVSARLSRLRWAREFGRADGAARRCARAAGETDSAPARPPADRTRRPPLVAGGLVQRRRRITGSEPLRSSIQSRIQVARP